MENNQSNDNLDLTDKYYLAKLLLQKYDIFHDFFKLQLENYTVACCNISIGGDVKMDAASKMIIYDLKTEKKYKKTKNKVIKTTKSKISTANYKKEKEIAKLNLTEWTQKLLWGKGTTVRVYIDGTEI